MCAVRALFCLAGRCVIAWPLRVVLEDSGDAAFALEFPVERFERIIITCVNDELGAWKVLPVAVSLRGAQVRFFLGGFGRPYYPVGFGFSSTISITLYIIFYITYYYIILYIYDDIIYKDYITYYYI